eukprot:g3537.t1
MMTVRTIFGIFCVFASFSIRVHALFEDQVGKADWYHQGIGEIKGTVFSGRSTFAITESGVLASLGTRTGEVNWRRVYPENEGSIDLIRSRGKLGVVTLSGGDFVHAWSEKGDLKWSSPVAPSSYLMALSAKGDVLVATKQEVRLLRTSDGTTAWTWRGNEDDKSNDVVIKAISVPTKNAKFVNIVGTVGTSVLVDVKIDLTSGDVQSPTMQYEVGMIVGDTVVSIRNEQSRSVALLSKEGKGGVVVHHYDLDQATGSVLPEALSGGNHDLLPVLSPTSSAYAPTIRLRTVEKDQDRLFGFTQSGDLEIVRSIDRDEVVACDFQ